MWVLILMVAATQSGGSVMHDFTSKERCEIAGELAKKTGAFIRYVCVEK